MVPHGTEGMAVGLEIGSRDVRVTWSGDLFYDELVGTRKKGIESTP